mgnify:CR=1 FL=1
MTNDTWPPPGELDMAMALAHVDALKDRVAKLEAILRIVRVDLANAAVSAGAVISKSIQEDASIVLGAIAEYRLHSEVDAAKRLAEFAIVVGLMDESVRPVRM